MDGWKNTITIRRPKRVPRPQLPIKATIPKVLGKQLGKVFSDNERSGPSSTGPESGDGRMSASSPVSASSSSDGSAAMMLRPRPNPPPRRLRKGCYCQLGSVVKTAICLALILGVTVAVAVWIYRSKMANRQAEADEEEEHADAPDSEKDLQIIENRIVKLIKESACCQKQLDTDPDLYIDQEGNLHLLSDLTDRKKERFGRNHLALPGSRNDGFEEELEHRHQQRGRRHHHNKKSRPSADAGSSMQQQQPTSSDAASPASSSVSVSSKSKIVIVYGTQKPFDPSASLSSTTSTLLEPSPTSSSFSSSSSSKRPHPAVQTFTVGQDVSPTFETRTPPQSAFDDDDGGAANGGSGGFGNDLSGFVTKTVTGFLDFTTTVGNTVMVFTPEGGKPRSESTLIVTPTRVITTAFANDRPTIGIEGLFQNFEKPEFPKSSIDDSVASSDDSIKGKIQPTSVRRPKPSDGVTHLPNGLTELDGAIDAAVYDRASREPAFEVAEDTFNVITASKVEERQPEATETHVQSQTIFSNFINGNDRQVGVVTATGGTLIAHGVTTVHSTQVIGTYLDNGLYAQVLKNTAKVFRDDVKPTPTERLGTVQRVTERPSFGIAVAGSGADETSEPKDSLALETLFDGDEDVENRQPTSGVGSVEVIKPTGLLGRRKTAAISDFRQRLKNRYQSYRTRADTKEEAPKPRTPQGVVGRGSVTAFGRSSRRISSSRERGRSLELDDDKPEKQESSSERQPRFKPSTSFSSRRNRYRNRHSNRNQSPAPSEAPNDLDVGESSLHEEHIDSTGRVTSRARGSNRFRNRASSRRQPVSRIDINSSSGSRFKSPPSSNNFRSSSRNSGPPKAETNDDITPRPKFNFKKFDRFKRPDLRESLLQKILNKGKPNKNTLSLEEQEEAKRKEEEEKRSQQQEAETRQSEDLKEELPLADEESLQDIETTTEKDAHLQTTLLVSTVYPNEARRSTFVEVATIRSPYSFNVEEGMSTRYITVTRSFTSSIKPSKTIEPSRSTPLFQTETIPAPENILTSSLPPVFDSTELISSIQTLPPVSLTEATPPLKTITETFSTTELIKKTSVLPVVINGKTRHHTLTHSYYVTRLVEAVKVVPTMKAYDFIPTSAFTDLGNVLDEAGSEKREEQLLPGELEFSDQDAFSEGPHEIRVKPPPGFNDDLSLIGSKVDPIDQMEKKKQQQQAANTAPNLQSSFGQQQQINPFGNLNPFGALQQNNQGSTPALPNQFGFSPEQLQQLALLQYLQNSFGGLAGLPNLAANPFAAAAAGPSVITTSKPVIRTETIYKTNTVELNFGNKKLTSTITSAVGVTTVTEYEKEMRTVSPAAAAIAPGKPPAPQQKPLFNLPQLPALKPQVIVTSEPIVKDTVIPSTITKELKITFRNGIKPDSRLNTPTLTVLTSTTMVSTRVTEYVTKTVQGQPGASALPFNPLAALLG